jgi:hypothetical protein
MEAQHVMNAAIDPAVRRFEYASQFPHGCVLHANDPGISFEYQPASASFGGPITADSPLPDVTLRTEAGTTLKNIAMNCIEMSVNTVEPNASPKTSKK